MYLGNYNSCPCRMELYYLSAMDINILELHLKRRYILNQAYLDNPLICDAINEYVYVNYYLHYLNRLICFEHQVENRLKSACVK